jgi:hypothetical protein
MEKTGSDYRIPESTGEGQLGTGGVLIQLRLFGVRQPVGALVAATCRSIRGLNRLVTRTQRLAAAGQSGDRSPHSKDLLVWIGLCVILVLTGSAAAVVPINPPILISESTSTRAIALESVAFTREPFSLRSHYAGTPDQRTRVMVFAMNLPLQAGEDLSVVSADAEDAAHQHHPLTVESIRPVPSCEWMSAVVFKLNDDLGDVGDVLISVSYRSVMSNRVRIGIGHRRCRRGPYTCPTLHD